MIDYIYNEKAFKRLLMEAFGFTPLQARHYINLTKAFLEENELTLTLEQD